MTDQFSAVRCNRQHSLIPRISSPRQIEVLQDLVVHAHRPFVPIVAVKYPSAQDETTFLIVTYPKALVGSR